ncbi:haloalkane dehalogenase [Ilumatobacter sp.]|uniref:haloalkane dehalogenase n=1 Tax=Ilumatobacter sp. TaxID=1967498 RepID=UPI003AF80060
MTETQVTPAGIEFVRTPDDRFAGLDDFPYEPKYADVDGLRVAYVDEGPADGPPVLLLHGEPTWGYLYRRMIPFLVDAGLRCVAPDLVGFGRSDKPTERSAYTYAAHVAWMKGFLDAIEFPPATLFAQDWGGLIGLRVATEDTHRFERIAIGNTGLPVGESIGPGFDFWLQMSQETDFTAAGALMAQAVQARDLTPAEQAAYSAPFPETIHTAGAIEFPCLVPITPEHGGVQENLASWRVLESWTKPFLTLWCPGDRVLGHLDQEFIDRVPGAAGQPHRTFEPGGHFLQDDRGEDVAAALVAWLA